jgi:hypothetical protein
VGVRMGGLPPEPNPVLALQAPAGLIMDLLLVAGSAAPPGQGYHIDVDESSCPAFSLQVPLWGSLAPPPCKLLHRTTNSK